MSRKADSCTQKEEYSETEARVAVGGIYCYIVSISLILQLVGE